MPRSAWLAMGAIAGALVAPAVAPAAAMALGAAGTLAAISLAMALRGRGPGRWAPALVLGLAVLLLRGALGPAEPPPTDLPAGAGPWTGLVETVSSPRDGQQGATVRIDPHGLRVAATLPRYPVVEPGFSVTVAGELRAPPDDGYGTYLERIGVAATLRSRTLEVRPGPGGPGPALERLRRGAGEALTRALPEPAAGLAAGILIGLRDRVDRDLAADFTTAGVSHVVAISGWNIAIVATCIAALTGRLGRRRRSVVTTVAIVAYVAFAGASASVVRAGAMAGVVLLARETGRAGQAAAALGWAATLLLLADPALIRDAGFQLSSLATAGLLAWGSPFEAALVRASRGRLPGWLTESLGVSFAAQLATLPIVLVAFGRLALVSPAINLVIAPLVAPAMAAGVVALAAGVLAGAGLPGALVAVLAVPAWLALGAMIAAVEIAAGLPYASVTLPPVAAGLLAAAVVAIIMTLRVAPRRSAPAGQEPAAARTAASPPRRAVRVAAVALVVTIAAGGAVVLHRPDGTTRITALDVGQGDAMLIEGPRGGRLLVDGGPDPDRLLRALDARLPPWDRRLDLVVLSHPHEDHVAGLALLLSRYRVGRVLEPGMRGPGPGYRALEALPGAPPRERLATGDRIGVDDVVLDVLWPDAGSVPETPSDTGTGINNVSIVLLGASHGRRFLLAGDIEEEIDPTLVARGLPRIDLLKVAHHGSRTASTDAFLDAVAPAVALVSAGNGNPYGHPAPQTLERLETHGASVFRTDADGSVEVAIGPNGLSVRSSGGRAAATTDPTAGRPTAAGTAALPGRPTPWLCGIPLPATRPAIAVAPRLPRTVALPAGDGSRLLYDRADDDPRADGRRRPAPLPRSPTLVPPSLAGGGGGGGLARRPHRRRRNRGEPRSRRVGRAPPRRRQAAAGGRSGPRAPPRRGLRGVAGAPGPR